VGGFIVVTLGLGLAPVARSPITSDWNYIGRADESHGITDERANYYPYTGLLVPLKIFTHPVPHEALRARFEGPSVKVFHCIGFYGYFAGPDVHVVDGFALTDPLLARLPMKYEPDWRVGHYFRPLPDGYLETLETGEDRLVDRDLAAYNEKLRLITRGPLFDVERWHAIVRMNLGLYDHLIDVEAYR
jgi:arabinofuranosyltransferase